MIQFYYPETIRGIVIALTDLFNDLKVERRDSSGTLIKTIRVPITFAPQEKTQFLKLQKQSGQRVHMKVPRLALSLTGITYDESRASGVNELRHFFDANLAVETQDSMFEDNNPTPFNFNFSLFVRTDSLQDFSQIIENILPYFNPTLNLRVKEFSFLNIERDLPTTLAGVSPDFLFDQPEDNMRFVNAELEILVKGWMYRPIAEAKIIKTINSKFFITDFSDQEVISGSDEFEIANEYIITSGGEISGSGPQ